MSKKKSATTMTLKDFHGGSIPSDLPLPSAPGVSPKPSQERPSAMLARSERTRHVSASPAAISQLPIPPRVIGRHFDEDERTPFDAPPRIPAAMPVVTGAGLSPVGSGTGITTWSPSRVAQASAVEKVISGKWHPGSRSDQVVPPVGESEIRTTASQLGMIQSEGRYGSVLSENRIRPPVEHHRVMSGPGYRLDVNEPHQTVTVAPGYGNVHFSGIGLDQRQVQRTGVLGETQVERTRVVSEQTRVIGSFNESFGHGSGLESKQRPVVPTGVIGDNRVRSPAGPPEMRRVGSGSEEMSGFGTSRRQHYNNWEERPRSVEVMERKDNTGLGSGSEMKEMERPASHEARSVAGHAAQKERTERPRLKLLPRTKPIESPEIRVTEDKMVSELHSSTDVPVGNDLQKMNANQKDKANRGNPTVESGVPPNEKPLLNLKPLFQASGGKSEDTGGKERPSVFGGARPRELVLKERGVDLASDDFSKDVPSNRPDSSSGKSDPKSEPVPTKLVNRSENYQLQHRNIRNLNANQEHHYNQHQHQHQHHAKHQHQPDTQRSTWRDNAQNNTSNRRAPLQQPPRPEPDTWRKPEPAKQEDVSGSRPGKGATALELAEAFSKRVSVSNEKQDSVSRNNNTVVFSRLLGGQRVLYKGPSPHQQINGY